MYLNQSEISAKTSTPTLSKASRIIRRTFAWSVVKASRRQKLNLMRIQNSGNFFSLKKQIGNLKSSFQDNFSYKNVFSDPKSTSEDSEIEEIEIIEYNEPAKHSQKKCESTKEWNFCQKCRAGWYKSEANFLVHPCFA